MLKKMCFAACIIDFVRMRKQSCGRKSAVKTAETDFRRRT